MTVIGNNSEKNLLLAMDVGNSNITMGCIRRDGSLVLVARIFTDRNKSMDEYAVVLENILSLHNIDRDAFEGCILSSVVPPLNTLIKSAITIVTGHKPLVVGPGLKTGLNILIDDPSQAGSDLVVGAVAAIKKYDLPLIIIDMGTATTISVINHKKDFLGGIIVPGLKVSQEALNQRTAQLPHISLEAPPHVIGRNTIDAMKSGVIFGTSSMIDGLIDKVEEDLGSKCTVVATGGLAASVVSHCKHNIIVDDELLLVGLYIIYNKNKEKIK